MFARQPRYRATCRDHGFRMPDDYDDSRGRSRTIHDGARRAPDEGTVPCNNDLLAENFIDDGDRIWLIDYEYSGNNDPCFELGNTSTECKLTIDQLDELVTAYYGSRRPAKVARAQLQAIVLAVRLGTVGIHPAGRQPARVRLLGLGDGALRGRSREFGARVRRLLDAARRETAAERRDLPDRARVVIIGGGVIGTSVAYHLTQLGWEDVVLLEQGQLSVRAPRGTQPGWSASCGRSESGTRLVQYSAELYAALEEETGLATGYKQCGGVTSRAPRTGWCSCGVRRPRRRPSTWSASCSRPSEAGERTR